MVIINVTCGLIIQFTHVYGIVSICACLMFPCVRINEDDNDDDDDDMCVMTAVACSL